MKPAQFFMIGIPGSDVLLRRPFSVCGLPGTFDGTTPTSVHVLYRIYGRATGLLASLAPGAPLQVLGPLGNGFEPPEREDAVPVLVAGGIGSAPFPALTDVLARRGMRARMIYGARCAGELPLLEWFRDHCSDLEVTTDDGSAGERGLVTLPLERLLSGGGTERLHLYACGPTPMLKAVGRLATEGGIRCDLSLEAPMACGFGVCLGCVVPVRAPDGSTRYDRVCVEGPVMRAERLAW
jgi:dihydroorotate dehydrogenase electron transfer subunit